MRLSDIYIYNQLAIHCSFTIIIDQEVLLYNIILQWNLERTDTFGAGVLFSGGRFPRSDLVTPLNIPRSLQLWDVV